MFSKPGVSRAQCVCASRLLLSWLSACSRDVTPNDSVLKTLSLQPSYSQRGSALEAQRMFPDAKSLVVGGNRSIRLALAGSRQFVRRQPFLSKALPTSFGFAFGDVLTQYMNWRNRTQQTEFSYEWQRGAKMALCGFCLATPVGLGLLRVLDAHVMTSNPSGPLAVSVKFTLDQIVGCAIWQACYCAIHPPYRVALEELLASVQANLECQSQQVSHEVRQVSEEFRRKLHLQTC